MDAFLWHVGSLKLTFFRLSNAMCDVITLADVAKNVPSIKNLFKVIIRYTGLATLC